MIQQIVFLVILSVVSFLAFRQYKKIWRNIHLGKPEEIAGDGDIRLKNTLLIAFGQKKMFKNWIPAIFHFFIYAAFLVTQIELIEIIVDGVFGVHRFFAPILGGFYTFIISSIEVLSLLALVGTFVFLARRNLLKIPRFRKSEMTGWPTLDANFILLGELVLITGITMMNGADVLLQQLDPTHYPATGTLAISSFSGPALFGGFDQASLVVIERVGWWLHILMVFGFILYLPFSKHLHILLAFPNVYFAKLKSRGEMENMPAIMNEVKSMMGLVPESEGGMGDEIPEFGAKDVTGLSWKNILDAHACTECGRCTAECPANLTGKKLSPRKIMMDVRDRATELGNYMDANKITEISACDDGKSLFDYISKEEIHACTTCNACVEACPVMINPLDIILQLRRYEILTESSGPADWTPMFNSLENSGAVWQIPNERQQWAKDLADA